MTPQESLAAFNREMKALVDAVPEAHVAAQAALVGSAFAQIAEASPVRTGEYRASHTIGIGFERTGAFLFEHPQRPEPAKPAVPRESPIPGPDVAQARASLEGVTPFQSLVIENQKFYAGYLEFGTALMAPRLIYEAARVASERRGAVAQQAFEQELRDHGVKLG